MLSGWFSIRGVPEAADGDAQLDDAALRPLHQAQRRQGRIPGERDDRIIRSNPSVRGSILINNLSKISIICIYTISPGLKCRHSKDRRNIRICKVIQKMFTYIDCIAPEI